MPSIYIYTYLYLCIYVCMGAVWLYHAVCCRQISFHALCQKVNTIFYYRLALCHFFCAIFHLRHYLLILNYMVYGDSVSFIHSNYSGFINIRLELELKGHLPCISWNSPNGGYIALTHLFVHSARRRKSRLLLISFFVFFYLQFCLFKNTRQGRNQILCFDSQFVEKCFVDGKRFFLYRGEDSLIDI